MQSELGSPLHSQILTRNKYNVFKQDESRTVYLLTIQKSFSYCRIPYLLTPYTVLLTSYTSTFAELAFILDSCSNQQSPPERQPQAALQHRSPLPRGDVPLFSEININPCLQCFCDFTKKNLFYHWQWKSIRAAPGISVQLHLWNKGSGGLLSGTHSKNISWLTNLLSLTPLFPFGFPS